MNIFKHILLFILTAVQSFCGIFVVTELPNVIQRISDGASYTGMEGLIAAGVVLAALAFLTCWLRGARDWGLFIGIPEFILSPIAFLRWIIGTIALIISARNSDVEFSYADNWDEYPLNNLTKFLFGFCFFGDLELSKAGNILTHIFLCIPLAAAQAVFLWLFIQQCLNFNPLNLLWLIYLQMMVFCGFLLCTVRSIPTEVVEWTGDYVFKNSSIDMKVRKHSSSPDYGYSLSDEAREAGWECTEGGYNSYYTWWLIATWVFAPILAVTQTLALVFAFISPHARIYSCYSFNGFNLYYLSFLQKVTLFFFGFIVD